MKLIKAQITNYRSIEDSGEFDVDNTLCLVGKNEAGKSATLYALAGLNPHPSTPIKFDIEKDYPRRYLNQYEERHPDKDAIVIKTTWLLSQEDVTAIEGYFGKECLTSSQVIVLKRYKSDSIEWDIPLNIGAALKYLMAAHKLTPKEIEGLASATNTSDLITQITENEDRSESEEKLLKYLNTLVGKTVTTHTRAVLNPRLPKFMYFSHYDRMDGQIRVDTYQQRHDRGQEISEGEKVFIDFLEFAGTTVSEIIGADTYERLNAKCEAASNSITDQLLEYWTQNPSLEIEVRVTKGESGDEAPFNTGIIARARVKNNLHKVTVPFSERSAGFIWFFSFLVKFAQVRKDKKPLILLLDEPGLTLHGKAQADLLRYFDEKLAPYHQIIFSTHSPFMVPTHNFPGIKIVEDKIFQLRPGHFSSEGTKIREDSLATDRDTLFPLQGALGYELTQSLFIGKQTLLVEGPGDILYLQAFSNALKKRNRRGLDPRWTICPAGGIDKIQPFVSLFSGAQLEIAALTDYSKKDSKKFDSLKQNKILESNKLLNFASILGKEEADIEDIIHPELFTKIVNSAYSLGSEHKMTVQKLTDANSATTRLVKKAETYFNLLPEDVQIFDHFTPAMWLFQNPKALDDNGKGVNETLDSAERVIEAVNAIL
ncbi:AAA family ATPase [Dyadobacter chenhuakuii]|uniref:AAA family ATPase n=1 Tax=Dyadobacter chenhuakuii TaxID=2909339 RepID=A0ABY4XGT5_9BACT|nr:AAA family ATPase [Dyadobacter chenhuakuii]MCF2495610.1 AAA family ATPase [Dyadobacter chenhuakuii]USJ29644.1 AAA family ATPase [Dyadobacter chenhuakuii]